MFEIAVMLGIIFAFFYYYFGSEETPSREESDRADRIYFGGPR